MKEDERRNCGMDRIVAHYLDGIELGEPTTVGRIGLVPLFNTTVAVSIPYIALRTALEGGVFLIEESHESGTVGQIKVTNKGASPVLLLDGEELAGAKQNRVLNTTILVPANRTIPIPVSCTEQGRWSYVSTRFEESLSVAPPRVRRSNQYAVAESLRVSGRFAGNQSEVWSRVQEISDEAAVHSSTSAMRDVFKERLPALDEVTSKFPVRANQIGLVAVADDEVMGFDVVTRPEVYELLHVKLVRSYVLDASLRRETTAQQGDVMRCARDFIQSTPNCSESRHESVGLGYDYRYIGTGIVGSALAHKTDMIHCAFFRVPPEERQSSVQDDLSSHGRRRGFRM
jgi:hypothetical protein